MPFNSVLVVLVAKLSAEVWQHLACLPKQIDSEQLINLVTCFPLGLLGRRVLYIWTYLCVPSYTHDYYSSSSSSDDEEDDDEDYSSSANARLQYFYHYTRNNGYDDSSHSD